MQLGMTCTIVKIRSQCSIIVSLHMTFVSQKGPDSKKFRAMNGAHLASPIRGELGYAHRPQFGSQIHCPIGNQIWGPLEKDDGCPNFSLTVGKFVFSNSGNFRAKANSPKPS